VTIEISEASGAPAVGALIEGTWGGGANGGGSCTTGSGGKCEVAKSVRNKFAAASFTVGNVSHGSSIYDPGQNADPETDSDGTTITVQKDGGSTEPPAPPPGGPTMHVGDLDRASSVEPRNRWSASVTVWVHAGVDAGEGPLSGITVNGSWSSGGGGSCTTGADGTCTIDRTNLKGNVASTTFSVGDLSDTGGSYSYAPGDNHDPDGDSSGTAITVSQP
jgi:hypothetical protein